MTFTLILAFIILAHWGSKQAVIRAVKKPPLSYEAAPLSEDPGAGARGQGRRAAALPVFYGYVGALVMTALLGLYTLILCVLGPESLPFISGSRDTAHLLGLCLVGGTTLVGLSYWMKPAFHARRCLERWGRGLFFLSAFIAILITSVVVLLLLSESFRFFQLVSLRDFLGGQIWAPEISHGSGPPGGPAGGADNTGSYGALPLFSGTFLITGVALAVGGGFGLMVAIYTSQFAKPVTRTLLKPALEILAGIPTIVYGFFALAVVGPALQSLGGMLNLSISSESALGAGLVMGFMILPIISSLSDDALSSLPGALKQNALAMGATATEAIRTVLLPAAFPGIMASFLLAISRATGETMLVLMAASLQPNLTANPLEAVTTVTVQIVSLLVGDQEFDSAKTLSAFALALVLFLLTLSLNILALFFVNRHAKRYEL